MASANPWTESELRLLHQARGQYWRLSIVAAEKVAKATGRSQTAVWKKLKALRDARYHTAPPSRRDDGSFAKAMMRAIKAGLEHPPMIGVDARPGTKNPRFYERGHGPLPLTCSSIA